MIGAVVLATLVHAAVAAPAVVTVSPAVVDAVADSQVILKVPVAGMVRIAVDSEVGTACALVDHQRGPFLSDGVVGKTSCNVDVLLDAGLYKLRLTSPAAPPTTKKNKKKGKAAATTTAVPRARVTATLFADADVSRLLPRGQSSTAPLGSGAQLVRLLRLDRRREVSLDVAGRTVGDVRLWRDGAFIEDVAWKRGIVRGAPGRPVWHHQVSAILDPGDYALVAYGTKPQAFTTGSDDDTVFVAHDARPLPDGGGVDVVLPAWGFVHLRAPAGELAVMATAPAGQAIEVSTVAVRADDDVIERRSGRSGGCTIADNATRRSCAFLTGDREHRGTVVGVSGPAGAKVRLQVVPTGGRIDGRGFGRANSAVDVKLASPTSLVSAVTWPPAVDSAPLSCALDRLDDDGKVLGQVGHDAPRVGWTQAFKARFNSDGTSQALWLDLEKPGLYLIETTPALNASCEVFSLEGGAGARTRISGSGAPCNTRVALPRGLVEVRLYGGSPGVQTLRVGQSGLSALGSDVVTAARTGCTITHPLAAGRYRLRTTADRSDQLVGVFAGSAGFLTPLAVAVDPGRPVSVDVARGDSVEAFASDPAASLSCSLDGAPVGGCRLTDATAAGRLTLTATGASTLAILRRPLPPAPDPALAALSATPPNLPVVSAGAARFFDLDDKTARSFTVEVGEPGLYRIETTGLLATSCVVRTATSAALFSGERNGRGRNCRVEAFLKPGRFRVDVRAIGQSRGRAGLSLVAQPIVDFGPVVMGDERFLAVPAGTPAKHRLESKGGELDVGIEAQDADLACRVDDDDGWPMRAPPHACRLQETLPAGRYAVTVFPLSVESRRAVRAAVADRAVVLKGQSVHALGLNRVMRAELGADGKDRFRFVLAADADVGITLSRGVQGRLRPLLPDGRDGDVAAIVPPQGRSDDGSEGGGDEGYDGGDEGDEGGGDEGYDGGGDEGDEGGGDEGYEGEREPRTTSRGLSTAAMAAATVHQPAPPLSGHVVSLAAGTWVLETEHARGDVGIVYDVGVTVRDLIPGASVTVQAPAVLEVLAPASGEPGLVRLKTRGATDTACRLLDERGDTVARSQASGDDWNCAMALPLAAGSRHRLLVDAEVLRPGPTIVEAAFLPAKSTGELKEGDRFRVVGKVASAVVTPVAGEVVDVDLVATEGRFSCAAFDHDGRLLSRALDVERCPLLLWPADDARPFSLMVWTADRPASVQAKRATRSVRRAGLLSATADDGAVIEAEVARRGRYALDERLWCRPKQGRGAFVPCGGDVAADPISDGATLLLASPRGASVSAALREQIVDVAASPEGSRRLRGARASERQQSRDAALHLVDVRVRAGSSALPACGIDGGAAVIDDERCVASSSPTRESLLSVWTRPGGEADAVIRRRAVVVPERATAMKGSASVTGTVRLALPPAPFRAELAAVDDAWVVLLDDAGRAVDLCPPTRAPRGDLQRCVLRGRGGSVVVAPATDSAVARGHTLRLDVVGFDGPVEPPRTLAGSREVKAPRRGREHLTFAAGPQERRLLLEGPAIVDCGVVLDDGVRVSGCDVVIPAGRAGSVVVDHHAGPWRALLERPHLIAALRIGPTGDGAALAADVGVKLGGSGVIRRAVVAEAGVLRLRTSSGTCAVLTTTEPPRTLAATGDDDGCDLQVPVGPGTYRVAARGFAGAPLDGTLSWQLTRLTTLGEGRGDEVLALPGEARFFAIPLQGAGALGLGLQVDADVFDCALHDKDGAVVAEGCQVFTRLPAGTFTWRVTLRDGDQPRRFRPVVFGLKGAEVDVPDDWLRDFFSRVPRSDAGTTSEVR